ncbi:MAG: hypothetical protein ACXVYY_01025 [Oryzihumus sp.]
MTEPENQTDVPAEAPVEEAPAEQPAEQAPAAPEQAAGDVYDARSDQPELTTPEEPAAAAYATAVKALLFPERYDLASLHVDGVDFAGEKAEPSPDDPTFLPGA